MTKYKEEFTTYNDESNQIAANECNAIAFINQSITGEVCLINNLVLQPNESYISNFNANESNTTIYNVSWIGNVIGKLIIIKKVLA